MKDKCKVGLDLLGNPRIWDCLLAFFVRDLIPAGAPQLQQIESIKWSRSESKIGFEITERFEVEVAKNFGLFQPLDEATRTRFWKTASSRAFTYNGASFEIKLEREGQHYCLLERGKTKKEGSIEELAPGYPNELSFVEIPIELFIKQL